MVKGKSKQMNAENKKKERINQLKLEGQREAAFLYEKYQRQKLHELKFISDLLENEQEL